jgi:hypothetical protein
VIGVSLLNIFYFLLVEFTDCSLTLPERTEDSLLLFSSIAGGEVTRPSRPVVQRPLPRPQSVEPFFETHRVPLPIVCNLISLLVSFLSLRFLTSAGLASQVKGMMRKKPALNFSFG